MTYTVTRSTYPYVREIQWNHVDRQKEIEDIEGTYEDRNDTGLLVNCGYSEVGLLQNILMQMKKIGYNTFHMYYSKVNGGKTGGWHSDHMDVLIVASMGRIKYLLYNDGRIEEVILHPGDALYIDRGTPHSAINLEPRITCSFSE